MSYTYMTYVFEWTLPYLGVAKSLCKEQDLADEVTIRHHHGDGTEHGLEIVWQLCAASVTWRMEWKDSGQNET